MLLLNKVFLLLSSLSFVMNKNKCAIFNHEFFLDSG